MIRGRKIIDLCLVATDSRPKLLLTVCFLLLPFLLSAAAADSIVTPKQHELSLPSYIKLGGYGLLTYRHREGSKHHDFRPRIVYLSAGGQILPRFRYYVLVDLVRPRLYEYYGEWTFSEGFGLRLGQQRITFCFENQISISLLESIENSPTVAALAGRAQDVALNSSGHDIGLHAFGYLLKRRLHYRAGFFQGAGMNSPENNERKDFAALLSFETLPGLRLGGSLYLGEAVYALNGAETASHIRNRWAVGFLYEGKHFEARSEYIIGRDAATRKDGIYAMALYHFLPQRLRAFAKVDCFRPDSSSPNALLTGVLGTNYSFASRCRFQLNYLIEMQQAVFPGQIAGNSILAQLQIGF